MIPQAYIQAWTAKSPWPDLRQVEQDLIICRALCDLFSAPALRGRIAFRGGTAIHKLLFPLAATSNSPTGGQVKIPHLSAAR